MTPEQFTGPVNYGLPEPPSPKEVIACSGCPEAVSRPDKLDLNALAARMLGQHDLSTFEIGSLLKQHDFTQGVLSLLDEAPLSDKNSATASAGSGTPRYRPGESPSRPRSTRAVRRPAVGRPRSGNGRAPTAPPASRGDPPVDPAGRHDRARGRPLSSPHRHHRCRHDATDMRSSSLTYEPAQAVHDLAPGGPCCRA